MWKLVMKLKGISLSLMSMAASVIFCSVSDITDTFVQNQWYERHSWSADAEILGGKGLSASFD